MRGGGKGREGEGFEEGRREMERVKGRVTERGDARERRGRTNKPKVDGEGVIFLSARARERGRGDASGSCLLRHRRWRMRRSKKRQTAVRE